jgi:hypothetical protein
MIIDKEEATGWRNPCHVDLVIRKEYVEVRIDDFHIEEAEMFMSEMKHTLIKDGTVILFGYRGFRCNFGYLNEVLRFFFMFAHRNPEHKGFNINICKSHIFIEQNYGNL